MVQTMRWTVQLDRGTLRKKVFVIVIKVAFSFFLNAHHATVYDTCVMDPPCLVEEMSGGGSGMVSGLTAANRPPSCGRPTIEGWPPCWNADMKKRFIIGK